jgi:hypothetical protein
MSRKALLRLILVLLIVAGVVAIYLYQLSLIPDAPVRSSVGEGHVLTGVVKSSKDGRPVPGARLVFWLVGPDSNYDDAHRAKMFADGEGRYRFVSNYPTRYTEAPHIHVHAMAQGYRGRATEYFPPNGSEGGTFDVELEPDGLWSLLFYR